MSRAYLNSVRRPRITLRTVARDTESALTISLFEIGAPYLADLVHAKHPHPSFPADQAQRKNAHTQVRRGRYWTRKQPFRGSLLQAILHNEHFHAWTGAHGRSLGVAPLKYKSVSGLGSEYDSPAAKRKFKAEWRRWRAAAVAPAARS